MNQLRSASAVTLKQKMSHLLKRNDDLCGNKSISPSKLIIVSFEQTKIPLCKLCEKSNVCMHLHTCAGSASAAAA